MTLSRTGPLRRTSMKSGRRSTGPASDVIDACLERAHYSCEICGGELYGERGVHYAVHHRRPRQSGGSSAPDTNLPSNLLVLCTSCHEHVEGHRTDAYDAGWLIHSGGVPSQTLVLHALHGWCFLTDDGRIETAPPPVLRGKVLDLGGYWDGEASA